MIDDTLGYFLCHVFGSRRIFGGVSGRRTRFHDVQWWSMSVHGRCYLLVFGYAKGVGCYMPLGKRIIEGW